MTRHMLYATLSFSVALVLFLTLAYVILARRSYGLPETWASFGGDTRIRVEIAASALARARGLSYRDSLEEGRGMLFTFGSAQRHSFWMKGMRFPIDIVWLRDGEVVDVTHDIDPQVGASLMQLKSYSPLLPADDVLELPAGYAKAHGIAVGSRIRLSEE